MVPEARVRPSRFIFGPYSPWPIAFRVSGPDVAKVRIIANEVLVKMQANPHTRQANLDWQERAPTIHFILDQHRLRLMGLSSNEASNQIAFLLTGVPVTQVREDIRAVDVVARSAGTNRLDPTKLLNMTLSTSGGRSVPLSQIGKVEIREEEPILKRRDRAPPISVQRHIDDAFQPPEVATELEQPLQPACAKPPGAFSTNVRANNYNSAKA